MKSTSILKLNLMRAAMTLALIVTCAMPLAKAQNNTPSLPYFNGFEDSNPLDGWTTFPNSTTILDHWYHNGSYCLGFYGSADKRIALPQFGKPVNTLRLEFWSRPEGSYSQCGNFDVGYMTDLEDANTFVAVATYAYNDWSGYMKKTVEFTDAPDDAYYIIMRQYNCAGNYYWLVDDVTVSEVPQFTNNGDGTYTIWTAKGWGMFCDAIEGGESFNGKTVKLGADIGTTTSPITCMAGREERKFKGTFDGQGHTLTINYSGSDSFIAPFRVVSDYATFRNLTVAGTINSTAVNAGGLIGELYNDNITVEHCTSNVEITSTGGQAGGFVGLCKYKATFIDCVSSAVIHSSGVQNGGFVGYSWSQGDYEHAMSFTGCVFNGKLLQINGNGGSNGGFIGWKGASQIVTITNCLVNPAATADGETYASNGSATFALGWNDNATALNSYYTTVFGTPQGKQTHSISATGQYVTVANAGTATAYATSGITSYGTGIKYNNVLYAGNEDEVSLTVTNTPPQGYIFVEYTVSPEGTTLNGTSNPYTLTMPDENVTISAMIKGPVTYLDENGVEQTLNGSQYTLLTGGGSTSLAAGWYVVNSDVSYTGSIRLNGNVNLILCDGYTINTKDIYTSSSYNLTIYGQTNGTGTLSSISSDNGISTYGNVSIISGTVYAKGTVGIFAGNALNIRGGTVTAQCYYYYAITSNHNVNISGGNVTAIGAIGSTITLGWTNATDRITATSYDGTVNIASGKAFTIDGTDIYTGNGVSISNNKTLLPAVAVTLNDDIAAGSGFISGGENFYAQVGQTVTVDAGSVTAPTGYVLGGITVIPTVEVTPGDNNTYSFTVPAANVTVSARFIEPVPYLDENGVAQTCSLYYPLEGTETVLGTAGEETWYVAQPGTLNYSSTITLLGNTHIILCDGAAMNIGTSDSPVSGKGFYCNGVYDLSVYTQSGNTGALAIYSSQNPFDVKNLTLAGGNVNATSYSYVSCNNLTVCRSTLGISASSGTAIYACGDVTFSYVTATTNGSIIMCDNNNFAVDHSQLTVNATSNTAIQASGGNVTLSYVTANITSSYSQGFYCSSFAVDNSQLTVTAQWEAINANGGVITLGCTAATDFIKATSTSYGYLPYSYSGIVKIADGQTLYAGSNAYTGTLTDAERQAIGGQKLTNVAPPTFDYIGLDGTGATHAAVVIDADNMPTSLSGWYIVQGTVNYTSTINLAGDTHIILADGAVMNVNVTTTSSYGIEGSNGNGSLSIYGQSGQSGQLNVTSNRFAIIVQGDITIAGGIVTATSTSTSDVAIYAENGDLTITGCEVEATGGTGIFADNYDNNGDDGNLTIQNATVTATTTSNGYVGAIRSRNGDITIDNSNVTATGTGRYGIYAENSGNILLNGGKITANGSGFGLICDAGNVTIEGGQVETTGGSFGVLASNITLGWTNATDYIYVSRYMDNEGDPITLTKTFIDEASNTYSGTIEIVSGAYSINGKTLYPEGVSIFRKEITGYTETGGWVLIASPIGTVNPEYVNHMCSNNFDLYRFNQAATLEWENWKAAGDEHFHFDLEPGRGYLYANSEDVTLIFSGIPYSGNGEVTLNLTEGAEFAGWNLVGNPFAVGATLSQPYYRMNEQGSALKTETESTSVAAMEGVFVNADGEGQSVTFTAQTRGSKQAATAQANIMVVGGDGTLVDNAIVRFDGGQTLEKFSLRQGSTKLYIPQGGKDYAIAMSDGQGEMPVNFKANKNGQYTITVNLEGVKLDYLHLIDNMTGADVNLLANPSYTYDARTTDYASRFKLVFASVCEDADGDNETFAFISNGNLIVNGEGTLQVVDMMGRVVHAVGLSQCGSRITTTGMTPGVYVLRLIDGDNVRTQKIIIK